MIRYALTCSNAHDFDSWFQSGQAFDRLHSAGLVVCATCGTNDVRKSIMAPRLSKGGAAAPEQSSSDTPSAPPAPSLTTPSSPQETAIAKLRETVEAQSEDVGKNFVAEARKIHAGESPERPIYGEAKPHEAKALIEDGVPVVPLPFMPTRKTN